MLAITGVPRRVLDWRDFLAADRAEEELSARPSFRQYEELEELDEEHTLHIHQGLQKKRQEILWWSETYWSRTPQLDYPQPPHL